MKTSLKSLLTIIMSLMLVSPVFVRAQNSRSLRIEAQNTAGSFSYDLTDQGMTADQVSNNLSHFFTLSTDHSFQKVREVTDALGFTHVNYQEYYKGVPVEGRLIMLHFKDGKARSVNGQFASIDDMAVQPVYSKELALRAARSAGEDRDTVPAPVTLVITQTPDQKQYRLAYKTRVSSKQPMQAEEVYIDAINGQTIKRIGLVHEQDVPSTASTYYRGMQNITSNYNNIDGLYYLRDDFRNIETLNGYILNKYGVVNLIQSFYYTNSSNNWGLLPVMDGFYIHNPGTALLNNQCFVAVAKGVNTMHWPLARTGLMPLVFTNLQTPLFNGPYNLMVNLNGANVSLPVGNNLPGVYPWQLPNGCSGTYTISSKANPALDAHWGVEKTYDFYKNIFQRNGCDNNNGKVTIWVDALSDLNNASANAADRIISVGMGDGVMSGPQADLNTMAHEYTHLVTAYNGNGGLQYQGESGALNESFSDIFGTCVEFYTTPFTANWWYADGVILQPPYYLRSLAAPKLAVPAQPNTYQGQYFANTANLAVDAGGVHTNSGIQNYWFYLLCNGGAGVNDLGNAYLVAGIGMNKAQKIAYRTLMFYLTPTALFIDSYNGSLQAAADIFGGGSIEYKSVKQAWYAVGIGTAPKEAPETELESGAPTALSGIKVYPNPASGYVNIDYDGNAPMSAVVVSMAGVQVLPVTTLNKGHNAINISSLHSGAYLVRFQNGPLQQTKTLIVR